jgi:iron complex outermembrane recepter protein
MRNSFTSGCSAGRNIATASLGKRGGAKSTLRCWFAAFGAAGALSSAAFGQVVPATPPPTDPREIVELSPFTVNAEEDVGYAARSTLAGSRFKTELRDTPASISVMTAEFLSDIGATDLAHAMQYSTNAQQDISDATSDGVNPNGNSVQSSPPLFRIRGQEGTQTRDYFPVRIRTDTYNVDRVEDSRGPNSVLFGFGAPGGIVNVLVKQPRLDRNIRTASIETGSFESHRETVDLNQILLKNKLAVRVNALYSQQNGFKEYQFVRDRRIDVAAKWQVTPSTMVRAEYERALIRENKPRTFAMLDVSLTEWLSRGRPTFDINRALSADERTYVFKQSSSGRRTYIGNTGQLIDAGSTWFPVDPNPNISIFDRSLAGATINYGGPGQINNTSTNVFTGVVEQRLAQNTFLELSYNHQSAWVDRVNPGQTNMRLRFDPNTQLRGPGGTLLPNPNAGGIYIDTAANAWERNLSDNVSNLFRATLSTAYDAGKWGNFRLAGLADYNKREDESHSLREYWADRPFNANAINSANQVRRRNYVTEGDWSTYYINSPYTTGLLKDVVDPTTGRTLNSTWLHRSEPSDDEETQRSYLITGQGRFWKDKIVLGAGYRLDKLNIIDREGQPDATGEPQLNYSDFSEAAYQTVDAEAKTKTYGAMFHVTPNLSVFYNYADNQGLTSGKIIDVARIREDPSAIKPSPNSKGIGEDYGIAFRLLNNKLDVRLAKYVVNSEDNTDSYGSTDIAPEDVSVNVMNLLRDLRLVTEAERTRHISNQDDMLFNQRSEGYELSVTANPNRNSKMQLNYSYTDTKQVNVGPEIRAWMDQESAYWRTFIPRVAPGTLTETT